MILLVCFPLAFINLAFVVLAQFGLIDLHFIIQLLNAFGCGFSLAFAVRELL